MTRYIPGHFAVAWEPMAGEHIATAAEMARGLVGMGGQRYVWLMFNGRAMRVDEKSTVESICVDFDEQRRPR